jgi:hypothetical protein
MRANSSNPKNIRTERATGISEMNERTIVATSSGDFLFPFVRANVRWSAMAAGIQIIKYTQYDKTELKGEKKNNVPQPKPFLQIVCVTMRITIPGKAQIKAMSERRKSRHSFSRTSSPRSIEISCCMVCLH